MAQLLHRIFDASPQAPIHGIADNLRSGEISAIALITLDYSTGQSVRWVQGRSLDAFEGPNRRSAQTEITVEHVLASASLPFVFPAVRIGSEWHGDGSIRLAAPLSGAVHLGARRIIAMSTGYQRTPDEARTPVVEGYPPATQILGQLMNSIFLDVIDEDVARMQRMNEMINKLDSRERNGFKPIDLLVLRPSRDLGKLAGARIGSEGNGISRLRLPADVRAALHCGADRDRPRRRRCSRRRNPGLYRRTRAASGSTLR